MRSACSSLRSSVRFCFGVVQLCVDACVAPFGEIPRVFLIDDTDSLVAVVRSPPGKDVGWVLGATATPVFNVHDLVRNVLRSAMVVVIDAFAVPLAQQIPPVEEHCRQLLIWSS